MNWFNSTFVSRLFLRSSESRVSPPRSRRFLPSLLALEDRTVPSGSDLFADATLLSGNSITVTGSIAGATGEEGEPNHAGVSNPLNSIWWQWTATTSGNVEINTVGSDFDTTLAVYTGSAVNALTEVASNDDAIGTASQVMFTAEAGTTYFIAVDRFEPNPDSIDPTLVNVVLNLGTAVPNDDFSNATAVAGGTATGRNIGATGEAGEPDHAGSAGIITSVWWQWTAATSGSVEINTLGSNFDTILAVYTGSAVNALTEVASNDDGYDIGGPSKVTFVAEAGTTYFIAVDGFLSQTGDIVLNLPPGSPPPPPSNNPPQINPQSFSVDENSAGGTNVGTVVATDPDAGQTLSFAITGGNASGAFAIDNAGHITVANAAALDYETTKSFTLTVTVTDNGSPTLSGTATITINLNDVDDTSVIYRLGQLSDQVAALLADGSLTTSQASDLQAKLDVVKKKFEQGNTKAAVNNLTAFVNQVNTLVSGGFLTAAEGDSLIDAASVLKRQIGG